MKISLIRSSSYDIPSLLPSVETLLEPWGGMSNFVKKGDRVLLKPNLLTASRPTGECVTRPELVYTIAKLVIAAGGKPFIGDSPAFGSAAGVAKANNYNAILSELNIPVVEFHGKRYQSISESFNHLLLSKEAMDADVVINIPKVKSHVQLTMTLGVKNLFGCVPGKMKAWWHLEAGKDHERFGKMLVETARSIAPDLTITDAIIAHQGNGPMKGEPRYLGILGAATNVFALDRAFLEILNVNPMLVPTAQAALKLGLCPSLDEMEFCYEKPADLQILDWQLPENMMPIDFGLPRIFRSTLKHLYIRFIKEPIAAYVGK